MMIYFSTNHPSKKCVIESIFSLVDFLIKHLDPLKSIFLIETCWRKVLTNFLLKFLCNDCHFFVTYVVDTIDANERKCFDILNRSAFYENNIYSFPFL
jgi:hypothetical protein